MAGWNSSCQSLWMAHGVLGEWVVPPIRSPEPPMRHRHLSPLECLRQPGWDTWLADALGLTDYSDRATRTLLARCVLVAAALRSPISAVARWVAHLGRETARK